MCFSYCSTEISEVSEVKLKHFTVSKTPLLKPFTFFLNTVSTKIQFLNCSP